MIMDLHQLVINDHGCTSGSNISLVIMDLHQLVIVYLHQHHDWPRLLSPLEDLLYKVVAKFFFFFLFWFMLFVCLFVLFAIIIQ